MTSRTALKLLFGSILLVMLVVTVQASLQQSVLAWGGLVNEPDRWWTIATLADAYCGFLTFYAWVFYKERGGASRVAWFIAIMLLGNFAMATYVLLQLARLPTDQPLERILLRTPAGAR
jgi:Protein of unknown function (DUF1475)